MTQQTSRLTGLVSPRPVVRPSAVTRLRLNPTPPAIESPAAGLGAAIKTGGDALLAAVLGALALPVVMACVMAVRLTSRGPAVYTQTRMGKNGRVFTLYKIRTMYHNCESQTGPQWSPPGDSRITPLGRIFRKLHLDELPQLWNVLKGDMSLIGPRPERPEIVARLRQAVPGYDLRHTVKPGITGYAQIHLPPDTGIRSVKNKVAYDRFYIRHASLGMELYILFATGLKLFGLKRLYQRAPRISTE